MKAELETSIREKSAKVGIIGLGYVGLPLISAFTNAGFRCIGYDVPEAGPLRLGYVTGSAVMAQVWFTEQR